MNDEHDEKFLDPSRRRFLQHAAALAAVGAASIVVGPAAPGVAAQQVAEPSSAPGDCDCSDDSALPLLAAAAVNGEYTALASTSQGPRLFSLAIDDARNVRLGAQLSVAVPAEFEPSALGVVRTRLVLGGGLPFLARSYQVDDQADPIPVFGVGPAAFFLDRAMVEPIALPDMSAQIFATVGEIAETSSGTLVLMIEHSGGEAESRYAAAVDVFEEVPGGWAVRASARDLGESGPNRLVVNGTDIGVELNTSQGRQLVGAGASVARAATRSLSPDVLGGDEVVSVVPVAGLSGLSIAIGKRSARLVEEVSHVL